MRHDHQCQPPHFLHCRCMFGTLGFRGCSLFTNTFCSPFLGDLIALTLGIRDAGQPLRALFQFLGYLDAPTHAGIGMPLPTPATWDRPCPAAGLQERRKLPRFGVLDL
jgi:hypothetical protein